MSVGCRFDYNFEICPKIEHFTKNWDNASEGHSGLEMMQPLEIAINWRFGGKKKKNFLPDLSHKKPDRFGGDTRQRI
jgi:hypothetical protein